MRYKVMIGDQLYRVTMSDGEFYKVEYDKDIIVYTIDEDNQVINARIENPSEHTLYLISQGRCFITINCKNFRGHSPMGYHWNGVWDPDDPRKTNPNWNGMAHSSGLGRGSYKFHKHWSLCINRDSLLDDDKPIEVTDVTNIQIPYHYTISKYKPSWTQHYYYRNVNIKGYPSLERYSDEYGEPQLNEFYFDFRLALLSDQSPYDQSWNTHMRVYQTNSKITRITFTKE